MDNKLIGNENNIVFYTDVNGNTNIEVILQENLTEDCRRMYTLRIKLIRV